MTALSSVPPRARVRTPSAVALPVMALLGGIGLGVFASLTDRTEHLVYLGQLAGPWILVAVAVGAHARRLATAALGATSALVAAVLTYYAVYAVTFDHINRYWKFWTIVALIVGPAAGTFGFLARRRTGAARVIAVAGISAVLLAEAVHWSRWANDDLSIALVVVGQAIVALALIPASHLLRTQTDGARAHMLSSFGLAALMTPAIAVALSLLSDRFMGF